MHINSILDVEREARSISRRTFRGSRSVIYQKEMHVVRISEAIRRRWDVGPKVWQAKHLRWFLEVNNSHLEGPTNYRYYCILKRVLIFQNRWDDFSPFLKGPWQKP